MRFHRLDLNLLVALDALLTEQSVSLAADRIHLSQSATSSALGRLREYFDDELLIMKGREMVMTARGHELAHPVKETLEQIRKTIVVPPKFDPFISDRKISIMTSDYSTEVILTEAFRRFKTTAPNMTFNVLQVTDTVTDDFERGVADIVITIDSACSKMHPFTPLFEDDFVVIGCETNPHLNGDFDLDTYLSLGHVEIKFGIAQSPSFVGRHLDEIELERKCEIAAPHFIMAPYLVIETERIATIHRRLARRLSKQLPVQITEAPLDFPNIKMSAQWHRSAESDPCINWVIEQLKDIGAQKDKPKIK